jgi:hypothetical protein
VFSTGSTVLSLPRAKRKPISTSEPVVMTASDTGHVQSRGPTRRSRKTTRPMNQMPAGPIIMKLKARRTNVHAEVALVLRKTKTSESRRTLPPPITARASESWVMSGGRPSLGITLPKMKIAIPIIMIAIAANGASDPLTSSGGSGTCIRPVGRSGAGFLFGR